MNLIQSYLLENFVFLIIIISTYFIVSIESSVEDSIQNHTARNMTLLLLMSINAFYLNYLRSQGIGGTRWIIAELLFVCLRPLPMAALIGIVDKEYRYRYLPAIINAILYLAYRLGAGYLTQKLDSDLIEGLWDYTYIITEWVYWIVFLFVVNFKFYRTSNENPLGVFLFISTLMSANIMDSAGIYPGILIKTYAVDFLLYYLIIHVYISRQINAEKDLKLREQRLSMMLSQIQPHFLYNSLNTIAALCRVNPKLAEETTVKFSKYLRENMYEMEETKTYPFVRELDHIKTYLDIEKLRFGDRLKVVFDIQTTDFEVPLLTLQPIVENAVKHGICKRIEGGTITIRTKKVGKDHIISIIDDGEGFDPELVKRDGKRHIGIENANERLKATVNTQMDISSMIGVGTEVTIVIPGEKPKIQKIEGERREIHSIGR